ncbi:molecular chaperone IbpA [Rhodobacter viridis]|uniref:Molecular chaperone IbpA n=1 Tax=Rhodobacter viridis TaxID=1054202 RepID=A0A318U0S5_9RHOB|nr:Hsp20 family protein [Rhodobacter viridis]PYF09715.1 molecular chaperone IbpA [Rhodobacter viridis]
MRAFDFSPLYRATIGFDRVADLMDRALATDVTQPTYPPYNIEKTDENAYRITIAVAGFASDELTVELREGALIVTGRKAEEADTSRTYLHRGIATRAFERRFALADHMKVTGATHADGMLNLDLVREVPEALKPRRIEIAAPGKVTAKQVDSIPAAEALNA